MSNHSPRGNLPGSFEGYPAYGAFHEIVPNPNLREFVARFAMISDAVITASLDGQTVEPFTEDDFKDPEFFDRLQASKPNTFGEEVYNPKQYYKLFDVDHMGISVVEMNGSEKAARAVRTIWEGQYFGAVEQEARNEVDRITGSITGTALEIRMDGISGVGRRLPNVDKKEVRQKLALTPDTPESQDAINMIEAEADIINRAIRRRLKQFLMPWDTSLHLTFSAFRDRTTFEQITAIQRSAEAYIGLNPLTVHLGELTFRHQAARKQKQKWR